MLCLLGLLMASRIQAFSRRMELKECYFTLYVMNVGILSPFEPQEKGKV